MTFDIKIDSHLYRDCFITIGNYENGGIGLRLMGDCGEGWPEPVDTLTYNLGALPKPDCQAVMKDNAMTRGIVKRLQELGIIKEVLGFAQSGYYENLPICEFNMETLRQYTK